MQRKGRKSTKGLAKDGGGFLMALPAWTSPEGISVPERFTVVAVAVYLGMVFMLSIASFATYGWDKRRALNGGRRTPERMLHIMAFLGGWPGALLGQRQFRHKTRKLRFQVLFWLGILAHLIMVGVIAYLFWETSRREIPA